MKHVIGLLLIILASIGHSETTYGPYPLRVETVNEEIDPQQQYTEYFIISDDYNYDIKIMNRSKSATCILGLSNGQSESWVVDEDSSLHLKDFRVPLVDIKCYRNYRS